MVEHTKLGHQGVELRGHIRDDRLESLGCVVAAANLSVKTKAEVNKTEDVSLGTSLDISDVANVDDGTSVDLGKAEDVNIGGGIGVDEGCSRGGDGERADGEELSEAEHLLKRVGSKESGWVGESWRS